jgi:hypothetical protein
MSSRTLRITLAALLMGTLSATTAAAQMDPEGGDVWVPPADPPPQQQPQPQPQPQQQQQQPWYQGGGQETPPPVHASPPQQSTPAQPADSRSDHERVVGRLAVGFMGATAVPIGGAGGAGFEMGSVSAPTIGFRYWISEMLGVDVGIGFGFAGGNIETGFDAIPMDNTFGMLIHAGLPLALMHSGHFKIILVPEANLGFASGTHFGAEQDDDRGRSGLLFQIGGRIGTEIHFGFMGIPNLSLQASVGLYFEYTSAGLGRSRRAGSNPAGVNAYGLGTTVMGEPWDIFLGSLTALYYF